jgi:hypothetical protein
VQAKDKPLNNKFSNLWTIVALLTLVLLLSVSYKLKDMLKPGIAAKAELDESCDLRKGACSSNLPGGGKVTFSIAPNDIPILRPLQLDVKVEGVDVSEAEVDFTGIGMDMGYNRPRLEAVSNNQFLGKAILPVCVRSKMDWEARVLLQTEHGLIMAPFKFYTLK